MMSRAEEYRSAEELRREIADLKIQLAFQEQFEQEVEEILEECKYPDPEMMQVIDEEEKGLLEEISRQYRKSRRGEKSVLRSKVGRVAAMVIAGMLISVSSAMAAIHMVRTGIFALDMQSEPQYTYIYMVQTGEAEVPEGWKGYYYPTFIPEGFEFAYIDGIGAWYFDENGNWMTFEERKYSTGTSVDTENAMISNVQINEVDATVIEKEGMSAVIWSIDNHYFVVSIAGEKNEAFQIAASVIMVK